MTRRLAELADGYGHSVAQLESPGCSTTQPSAARSSACALTRELEENVAASDWRLTDEIRNAVNQIFTDVGVYHPQQHPPGNRTTPAERTPLQA